MHDVHGMAGRRNRWDTSNIRMTGHRGHQVDGFAEVISRSGDAIDCSSTID